MKRKKKRRAPFSAPTVASASALAALTLLLRLIDQAGAQTMQRAFSRLRSWVLALWIGFKKNNNQTQQPSRHKCVACPQNPVLFNYIDLF